MRRIEYACDICGDVVRDGKGPNARPFVSFDLGLVGDHARNGDRFVVKGASETDRVICHACLAGMVALAKRTLPGGMLVGDGSID